MTERIPYGRGEVDDAIALLHRTSTDLDASVRAHLVDPCPTCGSTTDVREDWSTGQCDDCYADDHPPVDRVHAPDCDLDDDCTCDAHDLLERNLWDAQRDAPDPDTHEQKDQPDQ